MKKFFTLIPIILLSALHTYAQAPAIEWQKCLGGTNGDYAYSIQRTTDGGYIIAGETYSNNGNVSGNRGGTDYWVVKLDAFGNLQWQKCLGGTGFEHAYSIQQTISGGYIVTGYTNSNNGDVSGNHGGRDFWVVVLDALGNLQWQKCLGGTNGDYAYEIQQTSDGGYIISGYTLSNNGDVSGNHGSWDCWVVKLDASGNMQWQKCLGGTGDDYAYSIQQTTDGGYIVTGYTNSNNGDVSGNHGSNDYWVVKLDASGNIEWQKCFGGTNSEEARSIQQTNDGGYIIAGSTYSNDGNVSGNHGGSDYWVVKLDASGNIEWQKCFGGTVDEQAQSIHQTNDGGYIIAGYSNSNNGDVSGNHSSSPYSNDYWVVKLDASGNMQWQKCLGGEADDNTYAIRQTSDGGYIVAGYSLSNDGNVSGNHGSWDIWVVKLVTNVLPLNFLSFTGTFQNNNALLHWRTADEINTAGFDVERSTDGRQFTAISTIAAANTPGNHSYYFTDQNAARQGGDLYYRLKQKNIDGSFVYSNIVYLKENGGIAIAISPNPVKDKLHINIAGSIPQNTIIKIIDIAGKVVSNTTVNSNSLLIDVSRLPAGPYVLQYKNGTRTITEKVIVEK